MSSNKIDSDTETVSHHHPESAKILTRILAMVYDGLIILLISTICISLIQIALIGGEILPPDAILNDILKPMWFVPGFFYFAYYWRKTGQTPSMKVWEIKLVSRQSNKVTWFQIVLRYASALLGLGILLAPFNKNKSSLQDLVSRTSVIKIKR